MHQSGSTDEPLRAASALLSLARGDAFRAGTRDRAFQLLTETAAHTLHVERVSIWRYDAARSVLNCEDLYELSHDRHSAGGELRAGDYPAYFRALQTREIVAADDARRDPQTCAFTDSYLVPRGITSMMDVPVFLFGRLDGVVCHEHVGPLRAWLPDERTFALAVANLAALALEQEERRRVEEQLRASLREKEALLMEVHHRVKNNLQIITSLLSLQAAHLPAPEARAAFSDSQNRVRSLALLHDLLYRSGGLDRIDARRYFEALCSHLARSHGPPAERVAVRLDIDAWPLDVDRAVPCGLIVHELVSNALKHAFPHGRPGLVRLAFGPRPAAALGLSVSDDGVGLPAGLDVSHAESLGLRLVSDLVQQLEGTLRVDRDGGTRFDIQFPAVVSAEGRSS